MVLRVAAFFFTPPAFFILSDMAKDTFYFSHDYNARQDEKIRQLIRKHGMAGYGIFWSIIEDLYNNANALRLDYDGIAFDMRVEQSVIHSIINDFELFVIDGENFGSLSVERRLNDRDAKSEKARESARYRWQKIKDNANAMRTQCDGNAIKERKVNKEKEKKESKENENTAKTPLEAKFFEFVKFRKAKRQPILEESMQAFKNKLWKLSKQNEQTAIEILEQSIANGWTGIFELKEQNNNGNEKGLNSHVLDSLKDRTRNYIIKRTGQDPMQ